MEVVVCPNCVVEKPESDYRVRADGELAAKCLECERDTGKIPNDL